MKPATPGPYRATARDPMTGETIDHPIIDNNIHIVVGAANHTLAINPDCAEHGLTTDDGRRTAQADAHAIAYALNTLPQALNVLGVMAGQFEDGAKRNHKALHHPDSWANCRRRVCVSDRQTLTQASALLAADEQPEKAAPEGSGSPARAQDVAHDVPPVPLTDDEVDWAIGEIRNPEALYNPHALNVCAALDAARQEITVLRSWIDDADVVLAAALGDRHPVDQPPAVAVRLLVELIGEAQAGWNRAEIERDQARELAEAWKAYGQALNDQCAFYRGGGHPSDASFRRLDKARSTIARLTTAGEGADRDSV